jgi:hypothetical protein
VRRVAPFLAGTAVAALIAAIAVALQTTLHRPTPADALAVRVVVELERILSIRSNQHLSWLPHLQARCTSGTTYDTVTLGNGSTLTITNGDVDLTGGPLLRQLLLDAVARLAACPGLLAGELSTRLNAGKKALDRTLTYNGQPAYGLHVNNRPPTVELIVSRASLRPLAVRLRTTGLTGTSRLFDVRLTPAPQTAVRDLE